MTFKSIRTALWLTAATFTLSLSHEALARDLQGRLGLGYNNQWSNNQPGVSLKYGITRDIGLEAIVGAATTSPASSVFAAKFFKNLFYETNLNFYFLLGGGVLSANKNSGGEFVAGFGAEFFIPGVESLGFSMETGGRFGNLSGKFVLETMGVSFLNAGMHFYF